MSVCIYCFRITQVRISWVNVTQLKTNPLLCGECDQGLKLIQGNCCNVCSRQGEFDLCSDCQYWQSYYDGNDPLKKNISVYHYNDFMKDVITKWKYRGDYILGSVFKQSLQRKFNQHYASINPRAAVIPIPLSEERLYIRGFNQAELLASFLNSCKEEILTREINEKQAKKTKVDRMKAKNPFKLCKTLNKPVVLVDDIYTTGRTLRHAAQLLKDNGCHEIFALTLCRA